MNCICRRLPPWFLVLLSLASPTITSCDADERLLPAGVTYDRSIPAPDKFLGFEFGGRHLYHHEIVRYCEMLAEKSDRVRLERYAESYGGKPLLALTISSPENLRRLGAIRKIHQRIADPTRKALPADLDRVPLSMWMCYGVHGNEASATNISVWVAYHLAAAEDVETRDWLDNIVVRLDPSLNPDGFERFAHWTNNHRGLFPSVESADREHSEDWPSGRTNYYWFDLNRDWLPMRHPESRGRIKAYHAWKPNVVLDFHEMGTHSTFFFQPGVPARNNPLTPHRVFELTNQIAQYHAKALDERGALYYTQERFDDFYMGKGSTYPDLHGAVGILFEQASARGIQQRSRHGLLTFRKALFNQFTTSLSSLRASTKLKEELLRWQHEFYRSAVEEARLDPVKAYLVTGPNDPARLVEFERLLQAHSIETSRLAEDLTVEGTKFAASSTIVVPLEQPEYRFIRSLFERRTSFTENIFYDVSAWTLPLAFGLQSVELEQDISDLLDDTSPEKETMPSLDAPGVAYVIDWRGYRAPRLLNQLLESDVAVYAAPVPIDIATADGTASFPAGALIVPWNQDPLQRRQAVTHLRQAVRKDGVRIRSTVSALTPAGPDLGSDRMVRLSQPKVLLVAGVGASAYEAGEVWYVADRQLSMTITMAAASRLSSLDLSDYNRIVFVSGRHVISSAAKSKLEAWVQRGGTLIVYGGALPALQSAQLLKNAVTPQSDPSQSKLPLIDRKPYGDAKTNADLQLLRGAILRTRVDTTHPLGFGLPDTLPVFRNHENLITPANNVYANPLVYDANPVMSGYVSQENRQMLSRSASVVVRPQGNGRIIVLAENPNFRAFWLGTQRLFYNALFLPDMISNSLSD